MKINWILFLVSFVSENRYQEYNKENLFGMLLKWM